MLEHFIWIILQCVFHTIKSKREYTYVSELDLDTGSKIFDQTTCWNDTYYNIEIPIRFPQG